MASKPRVRYSSVDPARHHDVVLDGLAEESPEGRRMVLRPFVTLDEEIGLLAFNFVVR